MYGYNGRDRVKTNILQIIPAPAGMYARYLMDGEYGYAKVACLALVEQTDTVNGKKGRSVEPMTADADTGAILIENAMNLAGISVCDVPPSPLLTGFEE